MAYFPIDRHSNLLTLHKWVDYATSIGKEAKRLEGKIKKLISDRGFGFITAEDGKEVFFHSTALAGGDFDSLVEGTGVEFDLESGPKGPRAVNVRVEGSCESKKEEN